MSREELIEFLKDNLVVLAVGPLLLIWGLNTLLGLTIQFTFWNWLAGLAIIAVLRGGK